jgi:hypothetical protein
MPPMRSACVRCLRRALPLVGGWATGIYRASTEQYSENEFPWSFGPLTGTPEQGIDETPARCAGPPAGN